MSAGLGVRPREPGNIFFIALLSGLGRWAYIASGLTVLSRDALMVCTCVRGPGAQLLSTFSVGTNFWKKPVARACLLLPGMAPLWSPGWRYSDIEITLLESY